MASASAQSTTDRYTYDIGMGRGIGRGDVASFVGDSLQFNAGAGINFTTFHHMFGADAEYMYYSLPFRSSILKNGMADAKAHMQSLSFDGIVNVPRHIHKLGAYGIFGLGFYDRSVSLPRSQTLVEYTPYLPVYEWWDVKVNSLGQVVDQTISSHTKIAAGFNYGGGLTYRLGDTRAKLYIEWRYHRAYTHDIANLGASPAKTIVMPVTVGVRW
jgi:hypothetical protein